LLLFLALVIPLGCAKPPAARPEPPPAPVLVTAAKTKTVPIQVRSIGTVKVIATVNVRPRVGGELIGVHFTEGEDVCKGDKLFTLDRRPYDAAVKQAEAALARNQAVLKGAKLDLERVQRISAGGAAARAELEAAQTAVAAADAAVAADTAALQSARLQADFTTMTSPIDGRTGGLLVTAGNLLSANDPNPLVVINQISPIFVAFALPEGQLTAVATAQQKQPLRAVAVPRGGGPTATGRLAFIDNAVDPATGTVQLKAEFANEDRSLWPGQFVDVILTLGERPDSVVVPTSAVQTGPQGDYVIVVAADRTATVRPISVLFEHENEAIVSSGLKEGESVVVEGHLRVAPGGKVDPKAESGKPTAEGTK
jgi:multidrug efflux system membrane fusion protein